MLSPGAPIVHAHAQNQKHRGTLDLQFRFRAQQMKRGERKSLHEDGVVPEVSEVLEEGQIAAAATAVVRVGIPARRRRRRRVPDRRPGVAGGAAAIQQELPGLEATPEPNGIRRGRIAVGVVPFRGRPKGPLDVLPVRRSGPEAQELPGVVDRIPSSPVRWWRRRRRRRHSPPRKPESPAGFFSGDTRRRFPFNAAGICVHP